MPAEPRSAHDDRMSASEHAEQRRLRDAERVLEESLPFTIERDIPICNHWQTAVRSRLRMIEGAREAFVVRGRLGRSGQPMGRAVDAALGAATEGATWTARREDDGRCPHCT